MCYVKTFEWSKKGLIKLAILRMVWFHDDVFNAGYSDWKFKILCDSAKEINGFTFSGYMK